MGFWQAIKDWDHGRLHAWMDARRAAGTFTLDPDAYRGRDVAIIGPAAPVAEELALRPPPDGAALVRMNRGVELAHREPQVYGRGTHTVFHNFMYNNKGMKNRWIDANLYGAEGVEYAVANRHDFEPGRIRILRKLEPGFRRNGVKLRFPPEAIADDLRAELGGAHPTTGVTASVFFLGAPIRSLSIYGFTFFQTAYVGGYSNKVFSDADAQRWGATRKKHDVAKEPAALRRRILDHRQAGGFPVILGRAVAEALALPEAI